MDNIYFLTLIPFGYGVPGADCDSRCMGVLSTAEGCAAYLNEDATECGYYTWAVVEKLVQPGYHPKLEAVSWHRWDEDSRVWVREEGPPRAWHRIVNWAIG